MREGLDGVSGEITSGRGNRLVSGMFYAFGASAGLAGLIVVLWAVLNPSFRSFEGVSALLLPLVGTVLPLILATALALVAGRRFASEYSPRLLKAHLAAFGGTVIAVPIGAIFGAAATHLVLSDAPLSMEAVIGGMLIPFAGLVLGAGLQAGRSLFWAGLGYEVWIGRLPIIQSAIRMAGLSAFVGGMLLLFAALFRGTSIANASTEILAYCLIATLPVFAVSAGSNAGELGRNPTLKWIMRLVLAYAGSFLGMIGVFVVVSTLAYATSSSTHWLKDWNILIVFAPFLLILIFIIGIAVAGLGAWLYFLSLKRL